MTTVARLSALSGVAAQNAATAQALATARLAATTLPRFPGPVPGNLAAAYEIQDLAVDAARARRPPRKLAGWKVAGLTPELQARWGAERVVGPIFADAVWAVAPGEIAEIGVFAGFAGIEAEFAFRIGVEMPAHLGPYARGEVIAAITTMHLALEVVGTPVTGGLGTLGPGAVVADQGNNTGLVCGLSVPDWAERPLSTLSTRLAINGSIRGEGGADAVPGGPLAALEFLVEHLRQRGRGLSPGDLVTTGGTTGLHEVAPGDRVVADFIGLGQLAGAIVSMAPREEG